MSNHNKLNQERTETIVVFHDFSKLGDGPIEKLPPHITLLYLQGVMSRKAADLIASFKVVAKEAKDFDVIRGDTRCARDVWRGETAMYGDDNDILVDLVNDPSGHLRTIHEELRQAAEINEVDTFIDWRYAGPKNYSPHSTRNDGFIMPERVDIDSLSVVRKFGDKTMQNVRFDFPPTDL